MAAGSLLGCTVGPLHFVACLACLRTRTLGKCNTDRRSAVLGRAALYRKLDCSRAAAAAADSHGRLPPVGPEVAPPPSLSPALSLSLSLNTLSLALALTLLHTLGALIRPPATLVRCLPSHPAAASSTSAPPALDSDDKSHRSYHRQRIARHPAHLHPPQFASTLPSTVARPCLSKVSRPVVACPFLPPPPPLLLPSQSSPSPGNRCQSHWLDTQSSALRRHTRIALSTSTPPLRRVTVRPSGHRSISASSHSMAGTPASFDV